MEPLGSQITVMDEGLTGSREGELAPPKPVSALKARDLMATNVLCGEERPNMDEPQPAVPLRAVPADAKAVAAMTVAELRIALRERGFSPAGARATLVERLLAGLEGGAEPVMVPLHEHSSGIGSSALSAAYARADGQVVDGPPVHRGAGPPPPSHELQALLEGDASGPPPPPPPPMSEAARAMQASHIQILGDAPPESDADSAVRRVDPRRMADLAGQGIFTPAAIESAPWSALKSKDYKGNGIFDEAPPAPSTRLDGVTARHLPAKRDELGGHIAIQDGFAVGTAETTPVPAIGLSTAKSTELHGNDIIGIAAAPLPQPQPWGAYKSAELDSSVFSEQVAAEAGGGSARKSPGVPSPQTAAARARDYGSTLFTEEFTGPQPRKDPSASLAKHVDDLYSKGSAEGCTMAFAAPTAAPAVAPTPPPVAGKARRSSGGGVSSVVFG